MRKVFGVFGGVGFWSYPQKVVANYRLFFIKGNTGIRCAPVFMRKCASVYAWFFMDMRQCLCVDNFLN
jgi:hypothetical protein